MILPARARAMRPSVRGPLHETCQSRYVETGGMEHFCGREPGHPVALASAGEPEKLHHDQDGFYWDDKAQPWVPRPY